MIEKTVTSDDVRGAEANLRRVDAWRCGKAGVGRQGRAGRGVTHWQSSCEVVPWLRRAKGQRSNFAGSVSVGLPLLLPEVF